MGEQSDDVSLLADQEAEEEETAMNATGSLN